MTARLQNRVALVTGATQGIGAAIAQRFTREGAKVIGIDCRRPDEAERTGLEWYLADVQDHEALQACVTTTAARFKRIDILVNNAGVQRTVPLLDSSLAEWRETQAVNLEAQYVLCKLVAPQMVRARYGRIVNIASTQAIAVEPHVSAYAASKGGVLALTRSLAVELAPHGILVNCIAPGAIRTALSVVNGVNELETDTFKEWYVERRKIPLGRAGEADEVAAAATFLASEECSYVTGHTLVVDGGLTITF